MKYRNTLQVSQPENYTEMSVSGMAAMQLFDVSVEKTTLLQMIARRIKKRVRAHQERC